MLLLRVEELELERAPDKQGDGQADQTGPQPGPQRRLPDKRVRDREVCIAGPAWNDKAAWGHTPKGATGFGVAALLSVLESYA